MIEMFRKIADKKAGGGLSSLTEYTQRCDAIYNKINPVLEFVNLCDRHDHKERQQGRGLTSLWKSDEGAPQWTIQRDLFLAGNSLNVDGARLSVARTNSIEDRRYLTVIIKPASFNIVTHIGGVQEFRKVDDCIREIDQWLAAVVPDEMVVKAFGQHYQINRGGPQGIVETL